VLKRVRRQRALIAKRLAAKYGRSPLLSDTTHQHPQQPADFAIIFPMIVTTVTVSSKGQFTIPKDIRHLLGMQPGDKVEL
jgi:hypothetical protein